MSKATGNFQEDLVFFLKELEAPASENLQILANTGPFKEPKTPSLESDGANGTCELSSRNPSSQSNYNNLNGSENTSDESSETKFSQNYKCGPVVW